MSKDVNIKIGSFSCTIRTIFNPLGNAGMVWIADHFIMGNYGLDIKERVYKCKSSAVRYARKQLQLKYDANLKRISL